MSQRFLSVFVGMIFCMFLNAQISESFSSTNITSNWEGESSKFTIKDGRLTLSASDAGTAYLSSYSSVAYNGTWEANVQLDFKPTSSNYARIYLMSDSPALDGVLNGYFIQIGNASKQILLYSTKGTTNKIVGKSEEGRVDASSINLTLKVVRGKDLEWKVYSKLNDEKNFNEEFSVMDSTFTTSSFCGFYCKFTKTYVNKFSFDDFSVNGDGEKDTELPKVASFSSSDTLMTLNFSEWINPDEIEVAFTPSFNFEKAWNGSHTQLSIIPQESIQKGTKYTMTVGNIVDYVGNTGNDTLFHFAHKDEVSAGDLLFTEVMFNPYADGSEFVEIYNTSDKVIDLSELKLSTRKSADSTLYSPKKIADVATLIFPKEFKVLTNNASGITSFYNCKEETFVILSSFPSLRNETGAVVLFRSSDTLIIDNFYYESTMHAESVPNKGKGVSLTRNSPTSDEWSSSSAIDGYATPGYATMQVSSEKLLHADELCYPFYDEDKHFHLKYELDKSNYQATVKVYSLDGKCVNTLVNNQTLSQKGEIVWNGTDSNGNILSVAPYIVRFEAFQATTGERLRQSFVVLLSR